MKKILAQPTTTKDNRQLFAIWFVSNQGGGRLNYHSAVRSMSPPIF